MIRITITNLILIVLIVQWTTSIDAQNNKGVSYIKWQVDLQGNKIRKVEFKQYDADENLIKRIQYLEDGSSLIDSFSYSFKTNLIEKKNYNPYGLFEISEFEYDSNNKLIVEKRCNRNKILEDYAKHTYIDSVEIIKSYSVSYGLYCIDTLIYNEKNKLVSEIQIVDGIWFQEHSYEYDKNGNLIKEFVEANPEYDGIGIVEDNYIYDDENRLIKSSVLFPDKSKEYYIYEYMDE